MLVCPTCGCETRRAPTSTYSPVWRSDVRLRVAQALGPTLRDEAITLVREAFSIPEAKGAVVLIERAQTLLAELGAPD
jgi:hypothetical protein